jgi:ubiquinone biosynthesis protein
MRTIVGVFARHGFQNVAERIKLGRFIIERFTTLESDKFTAAERARMAFEELGPTFIKFGQLLATRPDLVPDDFVEEFKKLHDQVQTVPFEEVRSVLEQQFGADLTTLFRQFDETPVAAASIAQVYRAVLVDGDEVVVKVQRPGIEAVIRDDLSVLYTLAELLFKYIPETRVYNPVGIVNEFFKTLQLETNFVVEANNIRRFASNFQTEPSIRIPRVYTEYSGSKVIVMEAIGGIPLSSPQALNQPGVDPELVLRRGLRCYMKMVFEDGLFHADLHAGNLFVLSDNSIGLVDFGMVGRLNRRTQDAIAAMLMALATEDYDRLAYEYVDLAPFVEKMDVDRFATEVRDVIAPYYGLTMRNVNLGKILLDSTAVAARHGLMLPTELMMFFKSIILVEGMARLIVKDFDFLQTALEFSSDFIRSRFDSAKAFKDLAMMGRESTALMYSLPRQIRQALRKLNSPQFSVRLRISQLEELKRSVETSSNIVFLGLIIGSLILSGSLTISMQTDTFIAGMPVVSGICYLTALLLSGLAFYNYIKK